MLRGTHIPLDTPPPTHNPRPTAHMYHKTLPPLQPRTGYQSRTGGGKKAKIRLFRLVACLCSFTEHTHTLSRNPSTRSTGRTNTLLSSPWSAEPWTSVSGGTTHPSSSTTRVRAIITSRYYGPRDARARLGAPLQQQQRHRHHYHRQPPSAASCPATPLATNSNHVRRGSRCRDCGRGGAVVPS